MSEKRLCREKKKLQFTRLQVEGIYTREYMLMSQVHILYVIFNHTDKQRKNLSCIYKMRCLYLQMYRMRKKFQLRCFK